MPTKKLIEILDHEAKTFGDRAMIGGLGRFAETWLREAERHYGAEASGWVHEVAYLLRAYSMLATTDDRRLALTGLRETVAAGPGAYTTPLAADVTPSTSEGIGARVSTAGPDAHTEPIDRTGHQTAGPRGSRDIGDEPARADVSRTGSRRSGPGSTSKPVARTGEGAGLDSPVTVLRGVGPRQARRLTRLGLTSIRDMLYHFPRRYDDLSKLCTIRRLELGDEVTVIARVQATNLWRSPRGVTMFRATLSDGTGSVGVTWFNQPYLDGVIKSGQQLVVSGKVDQYLGRLCFKSPQWETLEQELLHTARIVPVYALTEGVRAKWLRRLMKRTADYWSKRLPDHLPASVRDEADIMDLETAIVQVHFPDSLEALQSARDRLAFDELFVLQVGLLRQRHKWRSTHARSVPVDRTAVQGFLSTLPYELTSAQETCLHQILDDMGSTVPMNRLLQGDVGSGKTVVAAAAITAAVAAGGQAAIMAPTEILAEQHCNTVSRLFAAFTGNQPRVRLLTSAVRDGDRERVYAGLADGSVDVVVGTHALIEANVQFADLRLAVVDEQHRFGVKQRAALRQKGFHPHLLTMTATPIPRSLELTVWGHLDVSTIDEMPSGRLPIETRIMPPTERERAHNFVRLQVGKGRQAFIICPLVEESDSVDAKAAVSEYERLQRDVFPDLRLGLLHGRMASVDKEATMAQFVAGDYDVLVATSVVEVGIDVPNASVMMIEGAERFGLAQLHQFRGRVGRGAHQSFCLLLSDAPPGPGQDRVAVMEATHDGFELAQKDLEMRGPGEFLGTRQSGLPPLKLASVTDMRLVKEARDLARSFFAADPDLTNPDNRLLARQVEQMWKRGEELH